MTPAPMSWGSRCRSRLAGSGDVTYWQPATCICETCNNKMSQVLWSHKRTDQPIWMQVEVCWHGRDAIGAFKWNMLTCVIAEAVQYARTKTLTGFKRSIAQMGRAKCARRSHHTTRAEEMKETRWKSTEGTQRSGCSRATRPHRCWCVCQHS